MVTMTKDVNVHLVDFPAPGKEMVVKNEDGSYTVLINARLSDSGQLAAYQHALSHIEEEDFTKDNVQEIEAVAHELAPVPPPAPVSSTPPMPVIKKRRRKRYTKWERYVQRREEYWAMIGVQDTREKLYPKELENHMVIGNGL